MLRDGDGRIGFLGHGFDGIKEARYFVGGIFIAPVEQLVSGVDDDQLVIAIFDGGGMFFDFLNAGQLAA